jgi:SulP family sulfate permease
MGFSLAFFILVFWMIPINLLSYVPNFFFGSLLLLICLDLMFEWLIDVRRGITRAEYATVLSTFALLQMLGLELGIFAGCLLHVAMVRWGFDMGNDEKVNEDDMAIANYKTTDQ